MSEAVVKSGRVAKWGNGPAVRLTVGLLQRANLRIDDPVEVVAREDEIVIRRRRPRLTMAELLAGFDPAKHRHELVSDDAPRGSETPWERQPSDTTKR